jgi:hypothetical protein
MHGFDQPLAGHLNKLITKFFIVCHAREFQEVARVSDALFFRGHDDGPRAVDHRRTFSHAWLVPFPVIAGVYTAFTAAFVRKLTD